MSEILAPHLRKLLASLEAVPALPKRALQRGRGSRCMRRTDETESGGEKYHVQVLRASRVTEEAASSQNPTAVDTKNKLAQFHHRSMAGSRDHGMSASSAAAPLYKRVTPPARLMAFPRFVFRPTHGTSVRSDCCAKVVHLLAIAHHVEGKSTPMTKKTQQKKRSQGLP